MPPVTFFSYWLGASTLAGDVYIFAGRSGASSLTSSDAYSLTDYSKTAATALSSANYIGSVAGNNTVAIYGMGTGTADYSNATSTTQKLTFSSDTWAAAATALETYCQGWGVGTNQYGYFICGLNGAGTMSSAVTRYTFSSDVKSAIGNLTAARRAHQCATDTLFIWSFGGSATQGDSNGSMINYKYDLSDDTCGSDTALGVNRRSCAIVYTKSKAVLLGGSTGSNPLNTFYKFTYGTATWSYGTAIGYSQYLAAAAASTTKGVIGGGTDATNPLSTAYSIDMAAETNTVATSLSSTKQGPSAVCTAQDM